MRSLQGDRFLKKYARDIHHQREQNSLDDDGQKTDTEKAERLEDCKKESEESQKESGSENTKLKKPGIDDQLPIKTSCGSKE
jgi:hypothetical protein